jgi:putative endonuclease
MSFVYILTNNHNTTFYIGVTSNLEKRIFEHKTKVVKGFTQRYNILKLVYFEQTDSIEQAIQREKQLKRWHRQWKVNLILLHNPEFIDLSKNNYQFPITPPGDPETSSG